MSNRLFQGLVYQMRDTINRTIGVVDENATIIACSDLTKIGEPNDFLAIDLNENNDLFIRDGVTYKPFGSKMKAEYAVFVSGTDELAAKICGVLTISLSNIKQYYDKNMTGAISSKTSSWTTSSPGTSSSRPGSCTSAPR